MDFISTMLYSLCRSCLNFSFHYKIFNLICQSYFNRYFSGFSSQSILQTSLGWLFLMFFGVFRCFSTLFASFRHHVWLLCVGLMKRWLLLSWWATQQNHGINSLKFTHIFTSLVFYIGWTIGIQVVLRLILYW